MRGKSLPAALALASALALAWVVSSPLFALEPDEMLSDPRLERRASALGASLRCVVCQGEVLEDSNAPLARAMRLALRRRIASGASDAQVLSWLTSRYGDDIVLHPPFAPATWPLWFAPALLLVAGFLVAARTLGLRRRIFPGRRRHGAPKAR